MIGHGGAIVSTTDSGPIEFKMIDGRLICSSDDAADGAAHGRNDVLIVGSRSVEGNDGARVSGAAAGPLESPNN